MDKILLHQIKIAIRKEKKFYHRKTLDEIQTPEIKVFCNNNDDKKLEGLNVIIANVDSKYLSYIEWILNNSFPNIMLF